MSPTREPAPISPRGLVPDRSREAHRPTVGRVNAALNDLSGRVPSPMPWHYAGDRELARLIYQDVPGYVDCLIGQRQFRDKAIAFSAQEGIHQFVELRAQAPDCLDVPPPAHDVTLGSCPHSSATVLVPREEILGANLALTLSDRADVVVRAAAIHDIYSPLTAEQDGVRLLDRSKPIGVLMISDLLHWDGDPVHLMSAYHDALPAGSMIAVGILGLAAEGTPEADALEKLQRHYSVTAEPDFVPRDRGHAKSWFAGWEIQPPGVTTVSRWPHTQPDNRTGSGLTAWCVIARKSR